MQRFHYRFLLCIRLLILCFFELLETLSEVFVEKFIDRIRLIFQIGIRSEIKSQWLIYIIQAISPLISFSKWSTDPLELSCYVIKLHRLHVHFTVLFFDWIFLLVFVRGLFIGYQGAQCLFFGTFAIFFKRSMSVIDFITGGRWGNLFSVHKVFLFALFEARKIVLFLWDVDVLFNERCEASFESWFVR